MKPQLYTEIALTRDVPEYQLRRGDVATLIDYVPHSAGGEDGCVLEVFNGIGETIAVLAVPLSAIEALRDDQILSVRTVGKTA